MRRKRRIQQVLYISLGNINNSIDQISYLIMIFLLDLICI